MILADVVAKFDDDVTLYIGSLEGSSYWFIGTKQEFFEDISKINKSFIGRYKRMINVTETRLAGKQKKSQMIRDNRNNKLYKEKVDVWTDLESREVLDIYDRIIDGVAVIVNGDEKGRYWLKGEM